MAVPTRDRQGDGIKPDRDEFSGISGIRDGTGMSFGKPGWDRDASFNPGIPDLFEIEKILGK